MEKKIENIKIEIENVMNTEFSDIFRDVDCSKIRAAIDELTKIQDNVVYEKEIIERAEKHYIDASITMLKVMRKYADMKKAGDAMRKIEDAKNEVVKQYVFHTSKRNG